MKHIWILSELGDQYLETVREVVTAWQRRGWPIGLSKGSIDPRVARRVRVVFLPAAALNAPGDGAWLAKYDVAPHTKVERILVNQNYRWLGRSPRWTDIIQFWKSAVLDLRPVLAHEIGHALGLKHDESGGIMDVYHASTTKWKPFNLPAHDPAE
jgi:hypothetical protein